MTDLNKGTKEIFFAIGSQGDTSNLATVKFTLCGKETITQTDSAENSKLVIDKDHGDGKFIIPRAIYKDWFKVEQQDGSNPECGIKDADYELMTATTHSSGFASYSKLDSPLVSFNEDGDLVFIIAEAKEEVVTIYLKAATRGAQSTRQQLDVTFKCSYRLNPSVAEIAVDYTEGATVDLFGTVIPSAMKIQTPDDSRCPVTDAARYDS